ncbi:transglycosylase SLT domain-containing protein [Serratia sp. L9]|uniref:transglycosylase SLT domain-containing protein n=1 Tax=Serratia sp. L9 TaxID=3423946 RepID=UPI003D66AFED
MHWPQIIWIVFAAITVTLSLAGWAVKTDKAFSVILRIAGIVFVAWLLWCGGFFSQAKAAGIPLEAQQYQRELTRNARAIWGLDAPVSLFAAQIHQESTWKTTARSPVGAVGLAQFMPATSDWIAGIYPKSLGTNQPYNPSWAMRALVTYNLWHWDRILGTASDCDRWAFVLSAYNGGLGWVQRDRKLATTKGLDHSRYWGHVETINAGRSAANWRENRGYPQRIIQRWQPLYVDAGWGLGVCHES